ncbi:aminomethyltransferase family protein [Desulforhopalus singaporensis]|uniref:Aminomethyltransferase n=1 Tax=Desulforhopalus singaporensis TaxID=91360 RepID=A0A1H0PT96_9BACT|nr:aminomethyltransferase family protein [Desulforhopalus singaporensis]SDP08224.1 aminomethyltransferase [Desulforhopalus singaporensis]
MSMETKKTLLHKWHKEHGANMAAFGAYDMPLWYPKGAKGEHLAVINSAGIFDTSHMAVVIVDGAGARELLQRCVTKDLECCLGAKKTPLVEGRCVYGIILTPDAHVLDDCIVYQVTDAIYMVVVNAGMGAKVADHLLANASGLEVRVDDLTDQVGKIDVQGKDSARIVSKLLAAPGAVLEKMPYFSFKGWFGTGVGEGGVKLQDGTPILLSRTGYTGEFGFEIFVDPAKLVSLWKMLLEAGEEFSLEPCGLAARDSLRAGAVLPLSHQDIGDWPFAENPWSFAVAEKQEDGGFTKKFIGSEFLKNFQPSEFTLPFAGFDPRKMVVSEKSYVASSEGDKIGTILTCATDMAIGRVEGDIVSIGSSQEGFVPKGLSCGFVKVNQKLAEGTIIFLTDGKRKIKVEIRSDVRPDRTARRPIKEML